MIFFSNIGYLLYFPPIAVYMASTYILLAFGWIFSMERILALQKEGHPIQPGTTGENLTIQGLDWNLMKVGAKFQIGEAKIELTGPAPPCKTISESFEKGGFVRISEKTYPGWSRWYASVSKEGIVAINDIISEI